MTQPLLVKANDFAIQAHKGQKRKGVVGLPYVCHPMDVANILARNGYKDDDTLLAAALLHDVVEDCGVKPAEIGALFGSGVVALVNEVTFINLTKLEKIARAPYLSAKAKDLKTADLISNMISLVDDPTAMSERAAYEYVMYAQVMVMVMKPSFAMQVAFDNALLLFNLNYKPN